MQVGGLAVEVRVERQLLRNDERRDEDDVGAAVGCEPAGEVERVPGLGAAEERHYDAPVADRRRPPGEPVDAVQPGSDRGQPHRRIW
jgi:hypothetical protein